MYNNAVYQFLNTSLYHYLLHLYTWSGQLIQNQLKSEQFLWWNSFQVHSLQSVPCTLYYTEICLWQWVAIFLQCSIILKQISKSGIHDLTHSLLWSIILAYNFQKDVKAKTKKTYMCTVYSSLMNLINELDCSLVSLSVEHKAWQVLFFAIST